jgi:flagellar L-ring protein precursor FlgH
MRLKFLMCLLLPTVASAQTAPPSGTAAPAAAGREGPGRIVPAASPGGAQQADANVISQQAGGSMLRATMSNPVDPASVSLNSVSFFSVPETKPRTIKKHDLVTIIVDENTQYSSAGTTDLKKSADFDAKIDAFVRLSLQNLALSENSVNTNPEIKTEGTRDFKGDGSVARTDSMTTRLTAEVLDVKPNGTLVLQARQHIKTDDEEQTMVLSGTCRVEDVTPDNTVLSTQMFDKEVSNTNKGAVRDTTKRGWVPKLLDVVNPF